MPGSEILCVGEVLWDALPAGLFLGGAPFNVACHLRAAGLPVAMVSRVGTDPLGDEVVRRAAQYGIATDLLQVDPHLPTGLVRVTMRDATDPAYEIVQPAAWDHIAPSDGLVRRAADARAIVFGTLAQRGATSRGTIERLLASNTLKVLDVNLRPPHDESEIVRASLRRADVVKMNEDELRRIAGWMEFGGGLREQATAIALAFDCRTICITRGRDGAAMWQEGRWTAHPGFEVEVRDTVGAGDAFLAVLLAGLFTGMDDRALLRHANLIGAYVVTQSGAVPPDQAAVTAQVLAAGESPVSPDSAAVGNRGRAARGKGPARARRKPKSSD